jgi:serine/threonine protein kinase
MHRDLKPSNLLLSENFQTLKLGDFGFARTFGLPLKQYTHEILTLQYKPPEIILGSPVYGPAVDMWSVGCIFYELAHKRLLFEGESEISQLFKIFQVLGTPREETWQNCYELPEMKDTFPKWIVNGSEKLTELCFNFKTQPEAMDLLSQMLQLEPSRRITVKGALDHPFLKESSSNL